MRIRMTTGVSTIALALALCCSAGARASTADAEGSGSNDAQADGQARIAATTLELERTFSEQFVRGQIDRDALAPLVDDVVQAMPEALRPKVEAHVAQVLDAGEKLASQLTPEQRAQVAAAQPPKELRDAQIAVVDPLGVPVGADAFGWGGPGAFGFPGVGGCIPYNAGYAYPIFGAGWNGITSGYSAGNYSSLTCGGGYGYGLGLGGLGW